MAILKNDLIDAVEVRTTTVFEGILDEFNDQITVEGNKYPLTDREQIFVETIRKLLSTLDRAYKRW